MVDHKKDPVLVVVQLSGGNDFMNTVVPYTAGIYYDSRPVVGLKEDEVLPIHDTLAWNPNCAPLQSMYEAGDVAVIQGIGYPNSNRSHFRAMDIWHTCEPIEIGTEGWVGRMIRELDHGGLVDVCTGTGVQQNRRDYLDRPAIFGPDERGGALSLWFVTEMESFQRES